MPYNPAIRNPVSARFSKINKPAGPRKGILSLLLAKELLEPPAQFAEFVPKIRESIRVTQSQNLSVTVIQEDEPED